MNRIQIFAAMLLATLVWSCGTRKELEEMSRENTELSDKNAGLQKEINGLAEDNNMLAAEFSRYKAGCEKAKKELEEVEEEINGLVATIESAREKITAALADFEDKGVYVYKQDGLVYVSLQEDLLYQTGSAVVGGKGKKALGSLAAVLNEYPRLKVMVIGNTDDVPFKSGKDNWSLSTERANGVVRILRDVYKVDPARMTAAGKGKYAPVADNATAPGRAKNRRTDIVLSPDLKNFWASVGQ